MSGREIYDNFHNGQGPDGLVGGATIVNELVAEQTEEGDAIRRLITRMEPAWQGDAAGAAQRGAGPLATEHEMSAAAMNTAQDLTNRQAGSFGDAKNAVVPVPPKPTPLNPVVVMTSPEAMFSHEERVDEYNSAAQHNVDVMNRYTGATRYNVQGTPMSYGSITDDQAGIGIGQGDTIDSKDFADTSGGDDGGRGGAPAPGPGPGGGDTGGADSSGGASAPVGGSPSTTPPDGLTSPEHASPSPTSPVVPLAPGADTGTARPVSTGNPGLGVIAGPGFGVPGEPGGGARGGGTGAGPRGGVGGAPRGGVVGGPGVGAEPHGQAGRSGPAVGGVAGAAGRGGPGVSGMPVGATGRSGDAEDKERKRSEYLEGDDPEETFGSDVLTAPPAIGDEDDNQ